MAKSSSSGASGDLSSAERQDVMSEERTFLSKLLDSALTGDGARVKELVCQYASDHNLSPAEVLSQFRDGMRKTTLHFACQSAASSKSADATEDIVSLLVSPNWLSQAAIDAMVRLKDKDGLTPIMLAAQNPDKHLCEQRVDALLNAGGPKLALARSHAGATALHYAAGAGSPPQTIKQLFDSGKVALNTCSKGGGTPLHWAAGSSSSSATETIACLVDECGADVNALNEQGMPALVMAAAAGNDAGAKSLVKRGADRDWKLPGNITVYHIAADLNLVGTLAALVGADAEEQNNKKYKEAQQTLSKRKNDQGETPLDLAAQEGHVGCVMLLLPPGENDEVAARALIEKRKAELEGGKAEEKTAVDQYDSDVNQSINDKDRKENKIETEAKHRAADVQARASIVTGDDKNRAQNLKAEGNAHFARKEWQMAANKYSEAIAADPTDATYYSNRSACCLHLDKPNEALADAIVAQQLRPEWAKGYFRVAMARLALERYEDAAVSAFEGLKLDAENDELKCLLQKCMRKGQKENREKAKRKDNR